MPVSKITSAKTALSFKKPRLFSSAYTRNLIEDSGVLFQSTREDLSDTNIDSTSSFRYDSPGMGVKSTQQIPLDWSLFENHTFFNSAEVNVNVAFDRIINEFPFDGTRKEFEVFFDSLTGFEKYVFDSFPKNIGYLFFDNDAYVKVNDFAGSEYPTISSEKSGKTVLDPGATSPFCFEFHLLVPGEANNNAVICQKLNNDHGFTLAVSASASTSVCDLVLMVTSGSSNLSSSIEINKEQFNHLVASVDRRPTFNRIEFYNNAELVGTSSLTQEFGQFDFIASPMYIGSGSSHIVGDVVFEPTTTLSGAIDDFRMFHGRRTINEQNLHGKKGIFASDDLALYFKFNEPTGSLGSLSNIVLDSSGNSLHSKIQSFSQAMRSTGSYAVPVTSERPERNPVLFPAYPGVVLLNIDLLSSASAYDVENPNLITRLIPQHYLWEGQSEEGFEEPEGTIGDSYEGDGLPGTGELGSPQILGSLLYVWAKFFDEQKIMIDHFSTLRHVDYDDDGTASDQFLPELFQYYGFDAPNFFSNSTIEQYVDADNLGVDVGVSALSLQEVQNQLWRRILVNLRDIVASKGTLHAVKSLIRSIGVNPDTTLRIREYGGKTKRSLADARLSRTEVSTMLDFSGSLSDVIPAVDNQGYPTNLPFVRTQYLSSSRVEAGLPTPAGTMIPSDLYPIHGISDDPGDGTLTSGSFTIEGLYKFPVGIRNQNFVTQSLFRLCTTGSAEYPNIIVNVVAISGSSAEDGQVVLYARPSAANDAGATDQLILPVTGVNIVDGNMWHVTAGRIASEHLESPVSSSWFLRVGRETNGEITKFTSTSSFHQDSPQDATLDVLSEITAQNTSGSFILIGSQSLGTPGPNFFLNRSPEAAALQTNFNGKVSQIRFWSKDLTVAETKEHVRNFKSAGVESPRVNYNFDNTASGSWERLRLNITTDQPTTSSDPLGGIVLTDFSQNQFVGLGTGFESNTSVIKPETFYYSHLSPRFDEASTNNKVRIRSMLEQDNIDEFDASAAPLYEITPSEVPNDDTRFSIDFSLIDSLDEDIITIFATLDELDNVLGDPNLMYSPDYPALENLREIYFNRLTDRINLKSLYEFFKWLDTSIGMFIEQLLPRKTNYLGTNFVVESHMLERPKVRYKNDEIYLEEELRSSQSTGQTYLSSGDTTTT